MLTKCCVLVGEEEGGGSGSRRTKVLQVNVGVNINFEQLKDDCLSFTSFLHGIKGMKRKQQEVRKSKLVSMETSQRRKHLCRLEGKGAGLLVAAAAVITQTPGSDVAESSQLLCVCV